MNLQTSNRSGTTNTVGSSLRPTTPRNVMGKSGRTNLRVSRMVFVITGPAEIEMNTVDRLLAEDLGWEFVDAKDLVPAANLDTRGCGTSLANSGPTLLVERLFDCADGETGNEAVKEQVVHERDGKTGDQASGHQRSPVVDISANQKDGDA